jgi:hypothetical protein
MKMIAFWDVGPSSIVEVDMCQRYYYLHHQGGDYYDDGGGTYL